MIKKKSNRRICWFGSSNASYNSLNNCEEAMIRITNPDCLNDFEKYFQEIQNISINISESKIQVKTKSVIDFINQGGIYNKLDTNFSPTIEIFFGDYKEKVFKAIKNSSDPRASLIIQTSDKIPLLGIIKIHFERMKYSPKKIQGIDLTRLKGKAPNIKTFSLFTSYGYWVPNAYIEEVERRISKTDFVKKRKSIVNSISEYIKKIEENDFDNDEFCRLIITYKGILDVFSELINFPKGFFYETPNRSEDHVNIKHLKKAIRLTSLKLEKDGWFYNELIKPYHLTSVPNIWNDPLSVDDFVESFKRSLEYEHLKKKSFNKVYQSIKVYKGEKNLGILNSDLDPLKIIEDIITSPRKIDVLDNKYKMMAQYNFLGFAKYNDNRDNFKFYQFSEIDKKMIERGKEIYWWDDDTFIMGLVRNIHKRGKYIEVSCIWENHEDEDFYPIDHECLYYIEYK
jgi:hypothetical protein